MIPCNRNSLSNATWKLRFVGGTMAASVAEARLSRGKACGARQLGAFSTGEKPPREFRHQSNPSGVQGQPGTGWPFRRHRPLRVHCRRSLRPARRDVLGHFLPVQARSLKIGSVRNTTICSSDFAAPRMNGRFACCNAADGLGLCRCCICKRRRRRASGLSSEPTCGSPAKAPISRSFECQFAMPRRGWITGAEKVRKPPGPVNARNK